jgi:hypothetical protein
MEQQQQPQQPAWPTHKHHTPRMANRAKELPHFPPWWRNLRGKDFGYDIKLQTSNFKL